MDRFARRTVAAWVALVAVGVVWGRYAVVDQQLGIDAAPFVGDWMRIPLVRLLPAALVAVLVVGFGPRLAARLRWGVLVATAGVTATVWATALAISEGRARLSEPLRYKYEYEPYAEGITSARTFVRTFVAQQDGFPPHVKGHPPGATLVPWVLDRIGLGSAGWLALLALVGWGVAIGATLVGGRHVMGEDRVRAVAPLLVLLPAAVWAGTSMDALFAGVFAVGIALALGSRRRDVVGGGLVLGGGLLLTFGGALLGAIPGVVHLLRRRWGQAALLATVALGFLVVVYLATGFSWIDGLAGARTAYWKGVASRRPSAYLTLAGNPAALAVAVGPAVVVGLVMAARRWRDAASMLPLVALGAVMAANASLLSKAEVERIWLPFVPWMALAAPGGSRRWLAAQAVVALAVQWLLRSPW